MNEESLYWADGRSKSEANLLKNTMPVGFSFVMAECEDDINIFCLGCKWKQIGYRDKHSEKCSVTESIDQDMINAVILMRGHDRP